MIIILIIWYFSSYLLIMRIIFIIWYFSCYLLIMIIILIIWSFSYYLLIMIIILIIWSFSSYLLIMIIILIIWFFSSYLLIMIIILIIWSFPFYLLIMIIQVSCFSVVSKLLQRAKTDVGEILSAFEFIDGPSLQAVKLISPHLMKRFFILFFLQWIDNRFFFPHFWNSDLNLIFLNVYFMLLNIYNTSHVYNLFNFDSNFYAQWIRIETDHFKWTDVMNVNS